MIGKFTEVLNFNRLFFELNQFICNYPPVLSDIESTRGGGAGH